MLTLLVERVAGDAKHLLVLLVCSLLGIRAENADEGVVLLTGQLVRIAVAHLVEYHDGCRLATRCLAVSAFGSASIM